MSGGVSLDTSVQRAAVLAEAKRWLGTPFHHQAQLLGCGVGCGTFLIAAYGAAGVPVPSAEEMGHFPPDWHLHTREERYLTILERYAARVTDPKPGDIALFRFGRVFGHSGVVVAWPRIIHAWKPAVQYASATLAPLAGRKVIWLDPWSRT